MSKMLPVPSRQTWIECANQAADAAGIDVAHLLAGVKSKEVVRARQEALAAVMRKKNYSIAGLARVSGFHHSTVLSNLRRLSKNQAVG